MSIVSRRRWSRRVSVMFDQIEQQRMMYNPRNPDPILADDNVPNDSFATATYLGVGNAGGVLGQTITGARTKYDVAYFQVTAATSATMQVRIDFQQPA